MSNVNLRINTLGRVGIWTGDDDAPYSNPLAYPDRLKFHTDLPYIQVIEEREVFLDLPARGNFQSAVASYPLFAHGRPGFPFILGEVEIDGKPCAFTGNVCVDLGLQQDGVTPGYYGRWLALGADATDVIVHEYVVNSWGTSSAHGSYAAKTVKIIVYITDEILE